jgi:hypothetical protein
VTQSLPGASSPKQLRHQAAQVVNAGLPSRKSIRRQYHRSIADTQGFSSALIALLRQTGGAGGQAYADAATQQGQIDAAAQQQLAALDPQYGGAAVKVGAAGDSAMSHLLAGQAAEGAYGARQPGIAAGRGALAQTGLESAMNDALTQQREAFTRGFGPALQQVTSNDQARALAIANLNLNQQQLQAQIGQANASLAERHNEFAYTHSPAYLRMVADLNGSSATGGGLSGFTPHEIQGYRAEIADVIDAGKQGIPEAGVTNPNPRNPADWKVRPAPLGAPNEPGQHNSIFALYPFLSARFPKPLVLAELRVAYPNRTWMAFVKQTFPGAWRRMMFADVNRAARQAGRNPWGPVKGPNRGP